MLLFRNLFKINSVRVLVMAITRPLVLCGPSGSGKSTLLNKLLKDYPDKFGFCTSHTTRNPRKGEINGVHYHFINRETMQEAIDNGEFIEYATFSGNLYGTSKAAVEDVEKKGKICILDIDTQGVKQVKKSNLQPHYLFVNIPSVDVLRERLKARNTETEESLKLRLSHAISEIEYGTTPGNFDIIIVNDEFEKAYEEMKNFIKTRIFTN